MNQSVIVTLLTGGGFAVLGVIAVALMARGKNNAETINTNVKTANDVVVMVNSQLDRETAKRKEADERCDRQRITIDRQHTNISRLRDYVNLLLAILRRNNIPEPTGPSLMEVDDE